MRGTAKAFALCSLLLLVFVPAGASGDVPQATLTPGGRAVAPPSAPPAVKAMIEAANRIRHRPYSWGGGHRHWNSRGYDCSGSVSYVMHAAGLLESPLDSTGFMRWGGGGGGGWVRIYANREHVFAVIAGLRWDTSFSERRSQRARLERRDAADRRFPPAPPARARSRRAALLSRVRGYRQQG